MDLLWFNLDVVIYLAAFLQDFKKGDGSMPATVSASLRRSRVER